MDKTNLYFSVFKIPFEKWIRYRFIENKDIVKRYLVNLSDNCMEKALNILKEDAMS
jgi:hypothetical protein